MINRKILLIATYPITNPQHGGQKRVKAMYDFYHTIFSEVKFVGVFHEKFYKDYDNDDCLIKDQSLIGQIDKEPFMADLIAGEAIYQDPIIKQQLSDMLTKYQPNIIQIEQVFPYQGLKRLLSELNMSPKLILSSHNIESKLKHEILTGLKVPMKDQEAVVDEIKKVEAELAQKADLVIAVSKGDAKVLQDMGAKQGVVIPNGIEEITPTKAALDHWQKFKKDNNIQQTITFVGSAHPPNLFGFQEMIGDDLRFLPEGSRLLLAGGIAEYFQEVYDFWGDRYKSFWGSVTPLGRLSDDNLAGLVATSEVLLLPITQGGGSNLKTAEAILSGRKVAATSYAFRSFEKYKYLPNIYIADDPKSFRELISKTIITQHIERSPSQVKLTQHVKWQHCLKPLETRLEVLAYGNVGAIPKRMKRFLKKIYIFVRSSLKSRT